MSRTVLSLPIVESDGKTAAAFFPTSIHPSLSQFRAAAKGCEGCELFVRGTQTVFGDGAAHASVILVGEQPGDQEDLQGKPFVGPAGRILNQALIDAGIDRKQTYVTNAVKHFNWVASGKRRLHAKPKIRHIKACRPWLEAEIALVKPRIVVCMGATAAMSLLGTDFRVTKRRGKLLAQDSQQGMRLMRNNELPFSARNHSGRPMMLATVHPSSILRANDEDRKREFAKFVKDLKVVAKFLQTR